MNTKDIDLLMQRIYMKDAEGIPLHNGDIIVSMNQYKHLINEMTFYEDLLLLNHISVIEYFLCNDNIMPFEHSPIGVIYKIFPLTKNNLENYVKIKSDILNNIKFSYKNGKIDDFKNTIFYKNIEKIQKGVYFRTKWIEKTNTFSSLEIRVNNKKSSILNIENNFMCYILDSFYLDEMYDNPNRNLEIFCQNPINQKHKEYFFKFKRGN